MNGCGRAFARVPGDLMPTVIVVIHLMVVVAMIGFVLLQKSEGGGLGVGSTGGFLTSRGTANVLTRATAILALVFFVTSLSLSVLAGLDRKPKSILNTGAPAPQQPGAPPAPLGQGGGLLDALRNQGQPQPSGPASPAVPQAPAGPQVPQSR
jgi:preprotein translocase subunit SecG